MSMMESAREVPKACATEEVQQPFSGLSSLFVAISRESWGLWGMLRPLAQAVLEVGMGWMVPVLKEAPHMAEGLLSTSPCLEIDRALLDDKILSEKSEGWQSKQSVRCR